MAKHSHWLGLWWAILQRFGEECYRTWVSEVVTTLAGGLAGALTDHFRSHGHSSLGEALVSGSIGAGIVFGLYAVVNLFRSVWLEHKGHTVGTMRQGIGGAVVVLALVGAITLSVALEANNIKTEPIILGSADPDHRKANDLISLEECKSTLASLTKPAPANSLRHRTVELVNDLNLFWISSPTAPQQAVPNPTTDDDRARNGKWDKYWKELNAAYQRKEFNQRIRGIVKEYQTKGVPVGYLDRAAEQPDRLIGGMPYGGFSLDTCDQYMSELCQLRELAFHVDAYDARVDSSKF
jgi:hypothetical protein